ncbi:hypothetical protein F7725_025844 [Dissostichus mawsoni]|uniref:Uncharacterized protein n=1 Tax=Dissostichus mawsoni TaxID=36200 RepID=A0A7J5X686_DISMA|nr:hypothetical protein F7725_025844 [Dissostichus mawsoni]
MSDSEKSISVLLREAANRLDGMVTRQPPANVRAAEVGTPSPTTPVQDWKSEPDVDKAAKLCKSKLLSQNENKKALLLRMDFEIRQKTRRDL